MTSPNSCRMNYHEECEAAVNKQANLELYASYSYLSLAYYMAREDVAMHGFSKWAKAAAEEEDGHAKLLFDVQVLRGGKVLMENVAKPAKDDWGTPLEAMQAVLALEQNNNQCLINLHAISHKHHDGHLSNFIEEKLLDEQADSVKEVADLVTQLKRAGPGLGEYMFDKQLMEMANKS